MGMKHSYPVPSPIGDAEAHFIVGDTSALSELTTEDFVARWSTIAYLQPGLHPDGYDCADSGWPEHVRPYAVEAWRRYDRGELGDDQLYCSYAQWAGLCDRMDSHTADEKEHRERIARGDFQGRAKA